MSPPVVAVAPDTDQRQHTAALLGGDRILRHRLTDPLDVHEMLLEGLPGKALTHLVGRLALLQKTASWEKAIGISLRTLQRHKEAPARRLDPEQSGRTWKFAEILALATAILGTQDAAEQWLETPAIALNQHRPIDLLATPAGTGLVEDLLHRMEYGVYA